MGDGKRHSHMLRSALNRIFPFILWFPRLKKPVVLRADLMAGITVALVLIPQSMAYAQIAGLPVQYGLFAAFLAPALGALFGSSRQLMTGPVAMGSLMTAAAIQTYGGAALGSDEMVAFALAIAFVAGVFQILLGGLRLGVLVNFISHPVVLGFTNAAAIIIAASQAGKILGIEVDGDLTYHQKIWAIVKALPTGIHFPSFLMALLAFGIMIGLRAVRSRFPDVLAGVVVTTVLSYLTSYTGKVVGSISSGLPDFRVPVLDVLEFRLLVKIAVPIAVIGLIEALSVAKVMAFRTKQRINMNQEMIGQGIANTIGSLFQGYFVSGSFSRSAINLKAGARSGFSSVITTVVVGITLLRLTPLLHHIPQATLGAVIVMAVLGLVRIKPIVRAFRVHPYGCIVAAATFATTLLFAPDLERGVVTGVILSLGFYLYRTMKPRITILSRGLDGSFRDAETYGLETCEHIMIVRFDGQLYFGNSGYFEGRVLKRISEKPELKFMIIDAEGINQIDLTGDEMLLSLVRRLKKAGVQVMFSRVKKQIIDKISASGLVRMVGRENFFPRNDAAIEQAWELMEEGHALQCPLREVK